MEKVTKNSVSAGADVVFIDSGAAEGISVLGPSSVPVLPGLLPVVQMALPCTEFFPAGQKTHSASPVVAEYWPAGQSEHVETPVVAEYWPAGH